MSKQSWSKSDVAVLPSVQDGRSRMENYQLAEPIEALKDIHKLVRKFWLKPSNVEAIKAFWNGLDRANRRNYISTIQPTTPESLSHPYMYSSDGRPPEWIGITPAIQELTLASITEGDNLFYLFEFWTEFENVTDYACDCAMVVKGLVASGLLPPAMEGSKEQKELYLLAESNFGQCMQLNTSSASAEVHKQITEFKREGMVVDGKQWIYLWSRMNFSVQYLSSFIDEFNTEVLLSPHHNKISAANFGCAQCRQTSRPGGGALLMCIKCQCTYYCSKECQQSAWAGHKARCKAIAASNIKHQKEHAVSNSLIK